MFLIRPAGANQNAKVAIGGGGPLLGSAIYGMPAGSSGPTAPTTPVARQTWNAGWRLTAYDPNPLTTELRPFRLRFRNLTGQAVQDFSFDMVHHVNAPQSFSVCAGPSDGDTQNSSAWTTPQTVVVPAATDSIRVPGYKRVDISLAAPVADGADIVVSALPLTSDAFTAVQGMNSNAWPDFGFPRFAGFPFSAFAVNGSWPGGFGDFFGFIPGIHFRNLTGGASIQIAHAGDSVGEQERPFTSSPDPLSREGWCVRGNQEEITNGRRFWWNSISNGSFTLAQYLARVSYLITTDWIETVDVVSLQVATHNEHPADVTAAQAQKVAIEVVADAIRAAGRGVIYTILSPPSASHQTANEIAGWQWIKDSYLADPHVYLDDIVADGTGTAYNVAYSSSDSPEPIHINEAGQILQAAALPARTATALTALGYTV